MIDVLTREQRSRNMSNIRSKNTRPEMLLRSFLHRLGYRYRLHGRNLPGKPDLVFPKLNKTIFVNGCYWHMHKCKYGKVIPETNRDFWQKKRLSNKERDRRNISQLRKMGWGVMVVWECQLKDMVFLERRAKLFLKVETNKNISKSINHK